LAACPWPCHRLLHLQRGVLGHREVVVDQRGHAGATRLPQQQRRLRVDVDEDDFDRRRIGLVARDDFRDAVEQHLEPRRQVAGAQVPGADGAAGHVAQRMAVRIDHAEAGGRQAGVDTENAHVCQALKYQRIE
jgi:hypothetical protein